MTKQGYVDVGRVDREGLIFVLQKTMALTSQLIKEVHYLEDATSQDLVDYSAVFFVSRLLHEQLADSSPLFRGLEAHTNVLSSLVSLNSGSGLNEVWAGLGVGQPCANVMQELTDIANLAQGGNYRTWFVGYHVLGAQLICRTELRTQIFQLLSVAMLPQTGSSQQIKDAIANLKTQVTRVSMSGNAYQSRH